MTADRPTALIFMGVSGSGKSTIAAGVAEKLGLQMLEGDDLHPAANIAKMSAGTPLTDEDRWPWLRIIAGKIAAWRQNGMEGIVTCSSLRRSYRDVLRAGHDDVLFVYLKGSRALLLDRMQHRTRHFMPASLLDTQLATLEEPGADEAAVTIEMGPPPDEVVTNVLKALAARDAA
ncbi:MULTISPECIES: gluconokinase [unclassified Acidisoma]|uniref:gluconokinase n=1 Tax=unclassified Acidisoma TaxID=2634065 RepID=UPI0020B1733D|nr:MULTISPECIES: gluconokinase [unclassified Acidisoma]